MHHSQALRYDLASDDVPPEKCNQSVNWEPSPRVDSPHHFPTWPAPAPALFQNVNGRMPEFETTSNTHANLVWNAHHHYPPGPQAFYPYQPPDPPPPTPMHSPPPPPPVEPTRSSIHLLYSPIPSHLPALSPHPSTDSPIHQLSDPYPHLPPPPPLHVLSPPPPPPPPLDGPIYQPLPPPSPPPLHLLSHPPPPPPSSGVSKRSAPPKQLDSYASQTEQIHDQLRDDRDSLSGSRFRLQEKRKELRALRQETGEKEGLALKKLVRFLYDHNISLPEDISEGFNEVAAKRDQLGLLEVAYEEDEEKYDQQEWKYTQTETKLVARLIGDDAESNVSADLNERNDEREGLTRFAFGPLISPGTEATTLLIPEAGPQSLDVLPPLSSESKTPKPSSSTGSSRVVPRLLGADSGVYTSADSKQGIFEREGRIRYSGLLDDRTAHIASPGVDPTVPLIQKDESRSAKVVPLRLSDIQTPQLSLSTGRATDGKDQPLTQLGWDQKVRLIDKWLWDMLSQSPVQKAHLKALSQNDVEDSTWWSFVEEHWSSNTFDFPVFHTGDSTASRQRLSTPTANTLGADSVFLKPSSQNVLLPEEQVVDAVDAGEMPAAIEIGDLKPSLEIDVPRLTAENTVDDAANSVSTDPATTHRTRSTVEDHVSVTHASVTSMDHESCNSMECSNRSHSHSIQNRGLNKNTQSENHHEDSSSPTTPKRQGGRGNENSTPRIQGTASSYERYERESRTPIDVASNTSRTSLDRFAQRYSRVSNPSTPTLSMTPESFTLPLASDKEPSSPVMMF